MKNNTVRVHRNGATKRTASQVQTAEVKPAPKVTEAARKKYYGVLNRPVSYEQVLDLTDDFQRMELACDEVINLLDLGAALVSENGESKVADSYSNLVAKAKHRLKIASNTIRQNVFNIESRTDDYFRTPEQLNAAIAMTVSEVAS